MEYFEILGWITAVVSVIIAQILNFYFNKRNLKAEQDHSERMLKMQFYKDDKKKAMIDLHQLLKKRYKTYPDLKSSIISFLDGDSGLFLPDKLKSDLRKELAEVDSLVAEQEIMIFGPPPEYPNDYDEWARDLSPEQQLDDEITSRLSGLKSKMGEEIRKYFAEE